MRNWIAAVSFLLSALVCHGEVEIAGQTIAIDHGKAVENYYNQEDAVIRQKNSLIKVWDAEHRAWRNPIEGELETARKGNYPTYVLSHGLNSNYNDAWLKTSAKAVSGKSGNEKALIISVNWDHFSGTPDDKNFAASTWINSVSSALSVELAGLDIKSFVGHSYGAHLLAATAVEMDKKNILGGGEISFVALDPAEETLTFTGDKDGKLTWMWSGDKKSKNWNLPPNVKCETYKSSGFLGSEKQLGDYNYFLAGTGKVTPRALGGDLEAHLIDNHSLACEWFAKKMEKEYGNGYGDGRIGGWFKKDTDKKRGSRKGGWDGIVNSDTLVLEYSAGEKERYTEWQDLCNAEAQSLLYKYQNGEEITDKSNWAGTVLDTSAYDTYRITHGKVVNGIKDAIVDTITGGGVNVPNILNATFADDPAEPKDAQTLANEAFNKEIDKIVKEVTDGDESLAQKIKDFVKGKIDEAIKNGEEWVENGGIRRTILEQVDKMLEGKVSPVDAQRIHNLVNALCNVNKDGGESFLETLGTDGKDLAVSLAVEALKKQLADALPGDVADTVNALLDVLKENGSADDYKKAALEQLQKLVATYVPYENTADTLNGILQSIADGNAVDVMDSIKDVGKNLGVDLLKDVIGKNLDPELANRINALLDSLAQNGRQGVTDEALKQIYDLIDKYAPGTDSAQKIKDIIQGTIDGTVTAPDFRNTATSIAVDGAKKLINDSDLPQPVKDAANAAIDGLAENGISGMTENVGDYIQDYITDQLGEDAGNAAREIFDAVVTPGEDAWDAVVTNAPTIGKTIGQKVLKWAESKIASQIDKLITKHPVLKSVLDRLGITGAGIVQGVKNVLSVLWNAPSLKEALSTLANMAVNFLKNIVGKLIDMALEHAFQWLASNLVPKVVNWATATLQKWAASADNPLLKKGLEWLSGQVGKCSKYASVKIKVNVGEKVIKKLGKIIDSKKTDSKVHIETYD